MNGEESLAAWGTEAHRGVGVEHRVEWIAASGEDENPHVSQNKGDVGHPDLEQPDLEQPGDLPAHLPAHSFPGKAVGSQDPRPPVEGERLTDEESCAVVEAFYEEERERKIYRRRTVAMLRRYMRHAIETGRLPSVLGREFFRAKVTSYTVVTFEDRVIFVHDMERCLNRMDEFSRQIIERHVLQEHDQAATGKLLGCTERTVRTHIPVALDLLSEILVEVGLLELVEPKRENSCQGGTEGRFPVSDCEDGKNKF